MRTAYGKSFALFFKNHVYSIVCRLNEMRLSSAYSLPGKWLERMVSRIPNLMRIPEHGARHKAYNHANIFLRPCLGLATRCPWDVGTVTSRRVDRNFQFMDSIAPRFTVKLWCMILRPNSGGFRFLSVPPGDRFNVAPQLISRGVAGQISRQILDEIRLYSYRYKTCYYLQNAIKRWNHYSYIIFSRSLYSASIVPVIISAHPIVFIFGVSRYRASWYRNQSRRKPHLSSTMRQPDILYAR